MEADNCSSNNNADEEEESSTTIANILVSKLESMEQEIGKAAAREAKLWQNILELRSISQLALNNDGNNEK